MAKNTKSAAFRKINVDQYEEEQYIEEQLADDSATGPNNAEVQSLLAKGNNIDALITAISTPPVNTKNQAVKDKALELVMKVMLSFKTSEIDGAVSKLDETKLDTLMKYIYRSFDKPSENSSASLLIWHDKVFAKTGVGSIIRVLTDRKRV
ncbi:hypothetical protein HELRODRAFT_105985 [Helobdella robusta]|uniref:Actin-related protein 2/3 complex subunit 5 n=1 Tax=Helobdella robusta TaxID=6412 RepID=T1EDZ0_HELRO|nr:hypothetical protein HELRODRAFT_105985 [Helobdella robusta]ESO06094.1 hypothetical protein HELRODRAFT_105985 [Helobdella robusta]